MYEITCTSEQYIYTKGRGWDGGGGGGMEGRGWDGGGGGGMEGEDKQVVMSYTCTCGSGGGGGGGGLLRARRYDSYKQV